MPKPIVMMPRTGAGLLLTSASCLRGGCQSSSGSFSDGSPMNPDFVDLLRAFIEGEVRFLIVGAYALAHHGRPRATGDLDVWVDPTAGNAPRVIRALEAFGAPLREVVQEDFARPGVV